MGRTGTISERVRLMSKCDQVLYKCSVEFWHSEWLLAILEGDCPFQVRNIDPEDMDISI